MAVENQIVSFFHCRECLLEKPAGIAPKDWARLEVGITADEQIQVWCLRHDQNVGILTPNNIKMAATCGCNETQH